MLRSICVSMHKGMKLASMWMQVERLSKLIETPVSDMVDSKRFEVINSTANVDKRLVKLFELIENDFLAKIVHSMQSIAAYKASPFASPVRCCCVVLNAVCTHQPCLGPKLVLRTQYEGCWICLWACCSPCWSLSCSAVQLCVLCSFPAQTACRNLPCCHTMLTDCDCGKGC